MAITYSGEGYKFQPQFANLSALQGLQPLDVTRKAEFHLQPLTYAPIPSSHPELVGQGIAKAIESITSGAIGGIEAIYKEEKEKEKESTAFERQKELAKIKSKEYDPYIEALKQRKLEADVNSAETRVNQVLPAKLPPGTTRRVSTPIESNLPEDSKINFTLTPEEVSFEPNQPLSSLDSNQIKVGVEDTAKQILNISPEYLTASESGGIVFDQKPKPLEENLPPTTIGQFSANFISPAEQKRLESKFEHLGFVPTALDRKESKFLSSIQKPVEKPKPKLPRSGDFDTEEQAQAVAYEEIPGFKEGEYEQLFDENGNPFFRVKPRVKMSQKEIAEAQKATDTGANFETEKKLRDEYVGQTKDFKTIQSAWRSIKTSGGEPSAAGDMSLIFGYMKLLDPGSTVREGEYANAQNAGGVPDRVIASYNKIINGQILSDSQRKDFLGQAKKQYDSRLGEYSGLKKSYTQLAKEYGLEPKRVVVEFDMPEEVAPKEVKKSEINSLAMELEQVPQDQRNSPEFLAKRKALYDLIKQEELAKKGQPKPTPVQPATSKPVFQPAVPQRPAQEYGESLESFFNKK